MVKEEKAPSKYRIDLCDGYFAMKDAYCYTLYNTRDKKATPLKPEVKEGETTDKVLGYYTELDSMLWAIIHNEVDAKALSKQKNLKLSEYVTIYENVRDEILNLTNITA